MARQSKKPSPSQLTRMRHKARIRSNRPLHRKIMLHPVACLLLLMVGVLLLGQSLKTGALSVTDTTGYSVHAKVPADPLTEPAVITSPTENQRFTASPINVIGTCPYKSYVEIFRNDTLAGTAICQPEGKFELQVGLLSGANTLQAHVFNITDDEGPLAQVINVTLEAPPVSAGSQAPVRTPTSKQAAALLLTTSYSYVAYQVGANTAWSLNYGGGTPPYALNVKWGDGDESNYVARNAGNLTINHTYKSAGIVPLRITLTDSDGSSSFLQLAAVIVSGQQGQISAGPTNYIGNPGSGLPLSQLVWPAYGVTVLMVLSFWLGEQQQYWKMIRTPRRYRR